METNHSCMVWKATASKRLCAPFDTPTRIYIPVIQLKILPFYTSFYHLILLLPSLISSTYPSSHLNMPGSPTFPPHPALIAVSTCHFFAMTRGSTSCPVPNLNSHTHSLLRSDRSSSYHIPFQANGQMLFLLQLGGWISPVYPVAPLCFLLNLI